MSSPNLGPSLTQYLFESCNQSHYIPTGSQSLDELLSGGIKNKSIYEINGLLNSGRSKLATNIVTNYLIWGKKVLWIDTCSKIPLNELVQQSGIEALQGNGLQYVRIDHLVQLLVLLKQLNLQSALTSTPTSENNSFTNTYSLIIINDFSDLVHYSLLMLEEELGKRRDKIDKMKTKLQQERHERALSGESSRFGPHFQSIPSLGPSIMVRQNLLMHQILSLLKSYNDKTLCSTVLLGSLNTSSEKLLLEMTPEPSQEEGPPRKRVLKTVYQPKLVPLLGEEVPWLGFLESRITMYKDWNGATTTKTSSNTLTYVVLRFSRPIIGSKHLSHQDTVIRLTKTVRVDFDELVSYELDLKNGTALANINKRSLQELELRI